MEGKEIQFRKKRDFNQVLSDSFQFLKQEYKPITKLTLIYILPFLVLDAVANVYFQKDVIWRLDFSDNEKLITQLSPHYLRFFIIALFEVFVQSLMIAVFYSYIEVYIKKGKGNFELLEVTQMLFSNGSLVITASLAFFVVVCFGLILCVVPGIFFANLLSLAFIILIIEKKGVSDAFVRSANLVRFQWLNTFGVNLVGIIVIFAANWVINFIFDISGFGFDLLGNAKNPEKIPEWYLYVTGIKVVIGMLFYIIPYTFLAFQYFSLDEQSKTEDLPPKQF